MHRVRIHQGNIAELNVDVIVNATSADLADSNGVSAAILRVAGDEYAYACQILTRCPVGDIRVTPGFRLAANWVIHAKGPVWRGGNQSEEQLLASCYNKAMAEAKKHNVNSIAFPAISFGATGFPIHRAIKVAIDEISIALRQNPLIEAVVFCCFDPVTAALYKSQTEK